MTRLFYAVVLHELRERMRDKWVIVVGVIFAALAAAVSLYGRTAEADAAALSGPSLVTLCSLFVPLVALILGHDAIVGERQRNTLGLLLSMPIGRAGLVLSKFVGRALALTVSIILGLGSAILASAEAEREVIAALVGPTWLLGAAFLAMGVAASTLTRRQIAAASVAVFVWFGLVFFYDLGLLAALVATDGGLSPDTVAKLVFGNPAGLYRVEMMTRFAGPELFENLGMQLALPSATTRGAIWAAWIGGPLLLGCGALLARRSQR